MDKKDAGGAFPISTIDGFSHDGMTLRDYFAGQAMAALIEKFPAYDASGIFSDGINDPDGFRKALAKGAYLYADFMVEERDRG